MPGPDRVAGACLCGAIRFSVGLPSLFCAHCHCSLCRRSHGAAYVTWLVVPRSQLRLESGEAGLVRFRSSDHGTRAFCARCGSALFFETTHRPDQVDVVLANLAGPVDRPPEAHIFFDDRAPWVAIGDDLPRLGGESGLEPIPGKPDAG